MTPWKCEMTNPFDHETSYVTIKSHIWPGAFAVTREKYIILHQYYYTISKFLLFV